MQTITFEFNGAHSLTVPDGDLCVGCARDIIEGRSYPLPVEDDFEVRTVVDLGAHAGEFTLMATVRWPRADIVAFEPQPDLAELVRQNCPQAHVYDSAVDESASEATPLYYSELGSVASSLFPGKDVDGNVANAHQLVKVTDARAVAAWRPDVLKLDIEGAELRVLKRIQDELPKIAYIYLEFHSEDIRVAIDRLLIETHCLAYARIPGPTQGEVMYRRRR